MHTDKAHQPATTNGKLTAMQFHLPMVDLLCLIRACTRGSLTRSSQNHVILSNASEGFLIVDSPQRIILSGRLRHGFNVEPPSQNHVILSGRVKHSSNAEPPPQNHVTLSGHVRHGSNVEPPPQNRVTLSGRVRHGSNVEPPPQNRVILSEAQRSRRTCFLSAASQMRTSPILYRKSGLAHALTTTLLCALAPLAQAAEHITLSNGYDIICDHRETQGERTRLYTDPASDNYVEVQTAAIAASEILPAAAPAAILPATVPVQTSEVLTAPELHQVLTGAGKAHDLDVDLLASVVHAESNSHVHARSRVGAQGLMQLMPGTAAALGVHDAFIPEQNVGGGAAYLDSLLTRYRNNLAFALAAYNAGPGAVDRWHGIPPYRETRLYVARIIHEFNGRYAARQAATLSAAAIPSAK